MRLTSLDIHHKEFHRSIRGYNEEEVDAFLDEVAAEFERFFKENNELKEQVEGMRGKVEQYAGVEESLQNALLTGQQAADQVKDSAAKESKVIVADAEKKAKEIIQDVQDQKKKIIAELQRLQEVEEKLRVRLQEVLNGFMEKTADFKTVELPPEVQGRVDSIQSELEGDPGPNAGESAVSEEPEESAVRAPSESTTITIQQPVVPRATEAPAETPAGTLADTTLAATNDDQFGAIGAPAVADKANNFFASPQDQESDEDDSDPAHEHDVIGGDPDVEAPASVVGYVDNTAASADVVRESPQPTEGAQVADTSPQAPDIGAPGEPVEGDPAPSIDSHLDAPAGNVSPLSEEPDFKVTLGAPEHGTSAAGDPAVGSQDADPAQTDALTDLNRQEVPEFDPSGGPEESAQKKDEAPDVVSSFFDDDLGGD